MTFRTFPCLPDGRTSLEYNKSVSVMFVVRWQGQIVSKSSFDSQYIFDYESRKIRRVPNLPTLEDQLQRFHAKLRLNSLVIFVGDNARRRCIEWIQARTRMSRGPSGWRQYDLIAMQPSLPEAHKMGNVLVLDSLHPIAFLPFWSLDSSFFVVIE